jgi:sulfur-carrier protein
MRLEICLYASLASHLPDKADGNSCLMDVEDGVSVETLLTDLNIPLHVAKIIFLNGIHAELSTTLKDGDRLAVFPPIAGG